MASSNRGNRRTLARTLDASAEEEVTPVKTTDVVIKSAFKLTLDDHTVHEYHPGVQAMPVDHLDHWFVKAQGVKTVAEVKAEQSAA